MDNVEKARNDYERNLNKQPLYHDGTPRPTWDNLGNLAKRSWLKRAINR